MAGNFAFETPLAQVAEEMHEFFLELTAEGRFTEDQALRLIADIARG
jgi:hypothetical protein